MRTYLTSEPHTASNLQKGIRLIEEVIQALEAFDDAIIQQSYPHELEILENKIQRLADRLYPPLGDDNNRVSRLADFRPPVLGVLVVSGRRSRPPDYRGFFDTARTRAIAILYEEIEILKEGLIELQNDSNPSLLEPQVPRGIDGRRVFVVHGHDEALKSEVARFLISLELEPVILHEQSSQGRTIIEKIEANSDVSYAVVLMTPDDLGGKMRIVYRHGHARMLFWS